ncbi:MAG: DUF1926 domain-containing protein [Candidatus Omnitrophica bacterium]|nr:DUF1926 domain-containing protein [Candidatus Omnitrophota bacterium]
MKAPVYLLMAIHCHQPVGNFGFVLEEAYAKAYEPFLAVLERHPRIRLALHYSGCLLDWLLEHQPGFVKRLKALVKRGQVELLASGYYEPILPLLPEPDRQGQIAKMRTALQEHCGETHSEGLWLTERVWEPDLPQSLDHAGIRYTMLDTNQFIPAKAYLPADLQVPEGEFWDLLGYYTTEYAGSSCYLFPASKRLRYWLPFQKAEQTIDFLKRLQGDWPVALTFADDGEKFGMWPKTFSWVYEEGWLETFFTALERETDWLQTTTFQDYLKIAKPSGRVYLPCGSYEEMLGWSGGHFRNFFAKYPESNAMQQKMLRISQGITRLKAQGARFKASTKESQAKKREALLQEAQEQLYAGQCNCAYWHGVFGGLYLSHLRRAVYTRLIGAESILSRLSPTEKISLEDADGDGVAEVLLSTPNASVIVDPQDGGLITEWNLFKQKVNVLDTLTRRYEPYHEKLRVSHPKHAAASSGLPASIHDLVGVKEENLASGLVYDDHRRSAFLDYALQAIPLLAEVTSMAWVEHRLWGPEAFELESKSRNPSSVSLVRSQASGQLHKRIRLENSPSVLECRYDIKGCAVPVVALEFNFGIRDERYLMQAKDLGRLEILTLEEPQMDLRLVAHFDPAPVVYVFPIETVSESEEGLERTYQGLCVWCCWSVGTLDSWSGRVRWSSP